MRSLRSTKPLPRAQVARIVDSEFATIWSEIKRGRKVQVTGPCADEAT